MPTWVNGTLSRSLEDSDMAKYDEISRIQIEGFDSPKKVTVIETLQCKMVRVSSAIIQPDGQVQMRIDDGAEQIRELRASLKPYIQDEVYVGQRVCVRGERGTVACQVVELLETGGNQHMDHYRLAVLNREGGGRIVAGSTILKRRVAYEFPASCLVDESSFVKTTVPHPGESIQLIAKSTDNGDQADPDEEFEHRRHRLLKQLANTELVLTLYPRWTFLYSPASLGELLQDGYLMREGSLYELRNKLDEWLCRVLRYDDRLRRNP